MLGGAPVMDSFRQWQPKSSTGARGAEGDHPWNKVTCYGPASTEKDGAEFWGLIIEIMPA